MTDRPYVTGPRPSLAALAAEDHVCCDCHLDYAMLSVADACEIITAVPGDVRAATLFAADPHRRPHRGPQTWSVVEYVCHLRDVYAIYTIRLHRTRTEDRPVLEPMLNDLRARRFRYNNSDLSAVVNEVAATAAGFLEETTRVSASDWQRTATRLPGEERTARWMVRQAAHEGVHHLKDIVDILDVIGL